MASMAADARSDQGWRVRLGAATATCARRVAKSVRFFSAEGSYTFRNRAGERWLAVAGRFQPRHEAKGMVRRLEERVPISALCPIHLSPRGSDHSRRLTDLRGVCFVSRQVVFSARERCQSLSMLRQLAPFGAN